MGPRGWATRAELLGRISARTLSSWVTSGTLVRLQAGVFATPAAAGRWRVRVAAALAGRGGAASHGTALALWELVTPRPGPVHVTVEDHRGARGSPGLVLHRNSAAYADGSTGCRSRPSSGRSSTRGGVLGHRCGPTSGQPRSRPSGDDSARPRTWPSSWIAALGCRIGPSSPPWWVCWPTDAAVNWRSGGAIRSCAPPACRPSPNSGTSPWAAIHSSWMPRTRTRCSLWRWTAPRSTGRGSSGSPTSVGTRSSRRSAGRRCATATAG